MQTLRAHYKSTLGEYFTIDQLLEKLRLKAHYDAYEWIRIYKPTIFKGNPLATKIDSSFDPKSCDQEIIKQFQRCYNQTCTFLQQYLQETHQLHSPTPFQIFQNCLKVGLSTQQETEKMLFMVDNLYNLCHECAGDSHHVVSEDLINYYHIMHRIIDRVTLSN